MSPHRRSISPILFNSNPKSTLITFARSFGRVFYVLFYVQSLAEYWPDAVAMVNPTIIDIRQGLAAAGDFIMVDLA
jgi:hypothetical protein